MNSGNDKTAINKTHQGGVGTAILACLFLGCVVSLGRLGFMAVEDGKLPSGGQLLWSVASNAPFAIAAGAFFGLLHVDTERTTKRDTVAALLWLGGVSLVLGYYIYMRG